jgi:hypothetical protein
MANMFLTAFVARYDQLGSSVPVLYAGEDPENTGYPRAFYVHGGESPQPGSYDPIEGIPIISDAFVTITVIAVGLKAVEDLSRIIMQGMKPETLIPLFLDTNIRMMRTNYATAARHERDPNGNKVYQAEITWKAVFGTDY